MAPEEIQPAQEVLDRQIDLLKDRKRARQFQDKVFEKIHDNRQRKGRYRIGALNLSDEEFVVAVEGEVLVIDNEAALAADAAGDLKTAGFKRVPTLSPLASAAPSWSNMGKLSKSVMRFTKPNMSAADAAAIVQDLLEQGVQASVNYVLPLGYVAKGEGGFERAAAIQPGPGANPGIGAHVAVVDTGIVRVKRNDGWLDNIPRSAGNEDILYQGPPEPPNLLDFAAGHGTFVTGILQQVAPTAQITVYRAIGPDGIGNDVQVAEAILVAAQDGAKIINLSLGTPSVGNDRPVATQAALEILAQQYPGVVVVASAGNSPDTEPYYPAAFDGVEAVAGLRADGEPSEWSSRGDDVAFSAVAEGVVSTYVVGQESALLDPYPGTDTFTDPSWALGTGTSFAAPQVVGEIANRMANDPGLTARQACDQLKASRPRGTDGYGIRLEILPGTPRL